MRQHARNVAGVTALMLMAAALALVAPIAAGAAPTPDTKFCSAHPAPCVVEASRNGTPVLISDPDYWISVEKYTSPDGENKVSWAVERYTGDPVADGALWVVKLDTGTTTPRVSFLRARDADTTRAVASDGTHRATVSGRPTTVSGSCEQATWPWVCDETAGYESTGFSGMITDYGSWLDTEQRDAMYGLNYATNVTATSIPPQVKVDPVTNTQYLELELASPHFRPDGTTLVKGFAHVRIPNDFLRNAYGIDNPSTLTGSGLKPVVSGSSTGSGTISVSPDGGSTVVDVTDMTFSARTVKIKRGTITPTRPTDVRVTRMTARAGRVAFDRAKARGSRITGYRARCAAVSGPDVATATADSSPVTVSGLADRGRYDCKVKALSRAGAGNWSGTKRMAATPA